MQDIAGCRLTVADIGKQDEVVAELKRLFARSIIVDRRQHPSHGYRAVHLIVDNSGKFVEIQIRTSLQHLWAELSEKLSDVVDGAIKYGGGDKDVRLLLNLVSDKIMGLESLPDSATDEPTRAAAIVYMLDAIEAAFTRLMGRKDDLSD
jgi:ppGpp synthetase/RelA/SpoT-type nucleotidyltranferase